MRETPGAPRPQVSVVLPVYNCPLYVGGAIESILRQTFEGLELIVIDDGSTDETPSVLERYGDPRIRLLRQPNRGLAATLNRGIELARGPFIARQDQDDISYPERLSKQIAYLDRHPRCALVGTWAEIWRENTKTEWQHRHPASDAELKYRLLLNNPFVHSSVMMRKSALDDVGGYSVDPARQPPEDYELWSRLARKHEVANVPEVLHIYREVQGSMSREGISPFVKRLITISAENIAQAAGVHACDHHVVNIAALVHGAPERVQGTVDLRQMTRVFRRAAEAVVPQREQRRFGREAEMEVRRLRLRYPEIFGAGLLNRMAWALARRARKLLRGST